MANSITTSTARQKFAQAHGGDAALPAITHVGWGDGGHNTETGLPIPPTSELTQVPGQFLKKAISSHTYPNFVTLRLVVSLGVTEGNGKNVSACGLYDGAGDLVAVKTFTPKGKDDEMEIVIDWDEEF